MANLKKQLSRLILKAAPLMTAGSALFSPMNAQALEKSAEHPITMEHVQNKGIWRTDEDLLRLKLGAALADQQKEFSFHVDGEIYHTQAALTFFDEYERLDPHPDAKYNSLFLRALSEYDRARKNPELPMEILGHTLPAAASVPSFVHELIKQRLLGNRTFTFYGKDYETTLPLPAFEQYRLFQNTNAQVLSPQTPETKEIIQNYVLVTTFNMHRKELPSLQQISNEQMFQEIKKLPAYAGMLDRFYQVCSVSGYPEIKSSNRDNGLIGRIMKAVCNNEMPPHYMPSLTGGGTIYVNQLNDIPAEMAHAFRHQNNVIGEGAHFVLDGLSDLAQFKSLGFTHEAQLNNYDDRTKFENDTHATVEPEIINFIKGRTATIEQMYAKIDQRRHAKDNRYTLTRTAQKRTNQGYKELKADEKWVVQVQSRKSQNS